ncbi:MAG: hypothetical protein AMK71_10820 [Nitrospira bacterium SG8_35_4]|nr:MAG: hypothetical protein AMK71_10820 [Nitrospira bacterium SG8_35_4]
MKKIKILHIAATSTGGVGLNILLLAKYMRHEQFDVAVAFAPGCNLDQEFKNIGVKLYPITMTRSPYSIRNILGFIQLLALFRKEHFDIVHTHTSVGGVLGRIAARIMHIPVILWSIHGWAFNYPDGAFPGRKIFKVLEKYLDTCTDHYVAVSKNMKDIGISAGITTENKISIIYHGIEMEKYRAANGDTSIRRELGIDPDTYVVGTAGRFESQKGMDDFIHAARFVRQAVSNVKFLIVGDGPLKGRLERLSAELDIADAVCFTGWKDNVNKYIECMDIFCMSSLWEALPFMLLEAMALQKPVVATCVGGIPEILEHGKGGFLMPPRKPDEFARGVIDLLRTDGLKEEMGHFNRRRIEESFQTQTMITQYENLYRGFADHP